MRQVVAITMVVLGLGQAIPAAAAGEEGARQSITSFRYESALRASQEAIGRKITDWPLTDLDGRARSFAQFRGSPLVLSLVFTSCHAICPTTTRHLANVVGKARDSLGTDSFRVAVLGFDAANDTPRAMLQFAREQGIDEAGWEVLSADETTIAGLTEELGFEFFSSPSGFDHIVQASVIDAEGRVYRQVYGETFATPLLIDPLIELVLNRPEPDRTILEGILDKVRFFCTAYDPARDAYYFDYSLFIGMFIGALVILAALIFMIREYAAGRRRGHA